jgi:AraC-like DNA-binding protein
MVQTMQVSEQIFMIVVGGFFLFAFVTLVSQLFFPGLLPKRNAALRRQRRSNSQVTHQEKPMEDPYSPFLSEEKIEQIETSIQHYFSQHKPFLDPNYSIKQLAEDVDIPRHYLSWYLNTTRKLNFRNFLNDYRMDHFTSKIRRGEWKFKTLEAIANESGFSTRATFIAACKRSTGMTPSEYLKEVRGTARCCPADGRPEEEQDV